VAGMDLSFEGVLARVRAGSCQVRSGVAKSYWRFIADSSPIRSSQDQVAQIRHFMRILQSRINTGYFASC